MIVVVIVVMIVVVVFSMDLIEGVCRFKVRVLACAAVDVLIIYCRITRVIFLRVARF
jgi:hypothetical protein